MTMLGRMPRFGARLPRAAAVASWWLRASRRPALATAKMQSNTIGWFYATGGTMVLLNVVLLRPEPHSMPVLWVIGAVAIAAGVFCFRWGPTQPDLVFHVLVDLALVLVITGVLCGGSPLESLAFGIFFQYPAIASFMCFSFRAACGHLAAAEIVAISAFTVSHVPASAAVVELGVLPVVVMIIGGVVRTASAAERDPLTSLTNRRGFDRVIDEATELCLRTGEPLCLVLFDFDGFKQINDEGGHAAGDRLLRNVSAAWAQMLRRGQTLARQGGDEFALVLPGCSPERGMVLAEQMRALALEVGGTTCSAGLAEWEADDSIGYLIGRADAALYDAKRRGRNQTVRFGTRADLLEPQDGSAVVPHQ